MMCALKRLINLILLCLITFGTHGLLAKDKVVLRIAGWDVYMDPERSNKTIGYQSFEQMTGVEIEFTPLSNLDDIVSEAESGNKHDVFIISNEGVKIVHDMGLVSPLNLELLPNYQNLHPNLKYSDWCLFDSRVYAVPWAWGPTGLLYDVDIIKKPDSWNILWDPRYIGKVSMWDDVSMIWTTALSLGYQNVYSLTKVQLENVKKKLFEFNKLSGTYYKGGGEEIILAKEGEIAVFNSWYDPSAQLKKSGKNFSMIIPKEGAVGMFDSYLLSNRSKNSALVHKYINHQISPEIQLKMVKRTGLAPSNIETLGLLEANEIKALHLDDADYFNRMLLWDHMPRINLYQKVLTEVRDDLKQQKIRK